ncbi:MAG: alpha/beta hydrolase family protein [Longimicrobiales bacterium]
MKTPTLVALTTATLVMTTCAPATDQTPAGGHPAVTDPVGFDLANPPGMRELSFESHGSKLNGLMYLAAGAGPHPTVILLHGYAGNERNLDLAQALRRAGANTMFFNYRGSWGSGGTFSLGNAIEDVAEAIAFLRSEESLGLYRSDPRRVALVGHSFGGFLAAVATAADPLIPCMGFLAGADFGPWGRAAGADSELRAALVAGLGADMDYEGGPIKAEAGVVVQDIIDRADAYDVVARAPRLQDRALFLAIGERDQALPKAEHHDLVLAALLEAGADRVTEAVYDDDHYFSAHRVELSRQLVDWFATSCWD